MRRLLARCGAFLRRERADENMTREMAAHLALMEDDFRRSGMTAQEARLAARRSWGGFEQTKEMHRDARSFIWLEQWLQDVRHAGRSLRKAPGFSAVAVISLAFGIGVNTAIFTLVNSILLTRLQVPEPERVVQLKTHLQKFDSEVFSYPGFREIERQGLFDTVIAFNPSPALVDFGAGERQVEFSFVTGGYFQFFGPRPALGRLLDREDDRVAGASPVCVLSHAAWQAHFAGDPGILGRTIRVSGVPLRVVGVAPRGFTGIDLQRRVEVWAATSMYGQLGSVPRESASWFWLRMFGRLKPGVSLPAANARLLAARAAIDAALPKGHGNADGIYFAVDGSRGNNSWRKTLSQPLAILMGAVTLVLMVACANLANLLLARTGERRQEFAIKLSLGISRWRLLRQLLLETAALTFSGGILAWAVGLGLTEYLLTLFNGVETYRRLHVAPDARVLLFTFAGCIVAALLAGLYPAWQAARTEVAQRLTRPAGARRATLRRALILVQVSLAVVLLFGATLFAHSLRKLKTVDLGYDIDRVLSVSMGAEASRRAQLTSAPPEYVTVLDRVRQLPGVKSAGLSFPGVLSGSMSYYDVELKDGAGGPRTIPDVYRMFVGPGLFDTLRMPLLRGRDFGTADRPGAPVTAIVNLKLASLVWPGENPVGKRLPLTKGHDAEVIGVVANSKYLQVAEETRPIVYEALAQSGAPSATLEIRGRADLHGIERDVRRIVKSAAPGFAVRDAASLELMRDSDISQERVLAFLSSLFGALGTALALVGIYGLISYTVTRRTREVGIRMSMGAQRGDVLWLFVRESLALVAAGIAVGLPLALLLARLAQKLVYGVTTNEPLDIAVTIVLPAIGGAIAAYVPGRRATRVEMVQALRYD